MTEINFYNISCFMQFIDREQNTRDQLLREDGIITAYKTGSEFRPLILMSPDMERALKKMTSGQFGRDPEGALTFRGVPYIVVVADGYLSFCYESVEGPN